MGLLDETADELGLFAEPTAAAETEEADDVIEFAEGPVAWPLAREDAKVGLLRRRAYKLN